MIRQIQIQNFKSIEDIEIELGRINVLIGANGCGKTNILEAICLGGAAAANKLDSEYLAPRGIRYAPPRAMRSGFSEETLDKPVKLSFENSEGVEFNPQLISEGTDFPQWKVKLGTSDEEHDKDLHEKRSRIEELMKGTIFPVDAEDIDFITKNHLILKEINAIIRSIIKDQLALYVPLYQELHEFLIYAPDPQTVRRLDDEERTLPLGIGGSGLFRLLQSFSSEKLLELKEHLRMIDWFEDLEFPEKKLPGERTIRISDQYISDGLKYFEQRVANEGFLFLLFYLSLFMSEHTPKFFAIDNLDNGLNPKLCMYLCKTLCQLSEKYGKQAIITTHNPAVLDGLDLKSDEERLFVVFRNLEGRTRVRRIVPKDLPAPSDGPPVRLSEAFLRGYIGGLPKNF
jgi:predicted ATP-dependent endonuclease of OLD family